MNNKNFSFIKFIIRMMSVFLILMFFSSLLIFEYMATFYGTYKENSIIENVEEIEEINEEVKTENTLIEIERTSSYKIFVDRQTRNMYITSNNYEDKGIELMYDGTEPKIYKEILDGQTYKEFQEINK